MLRLSEVKTLINKPEFTLTKQTDFDMVNKYFFDFDEKQKDRLSKMAIELWDKKKTKITNPLDLQLLSYYLDTNFGYNENYDDNEDIEDTDNIKYIKIAGKYKFNYSVYEDDDIRQENIFKLNLYNAVEKLKIYFPNVNITIEYEKPTYVDKKLKKANTTYKHDSIISITPKSDNDDNIHENEYDVENTYEIVLEYFEKIHNRFNDDDKKVATNLFADEYYVYDVNKDDMYDFMKSIIYGLIQIICTSTNDKYELGKILYYNANQHNRNINSYMRDLDTIMTIKKNNICNFKNQIYDKLKPRTNEGKKLSLDKFIKLIEDTCEIEINLEDDGTCESSVFDNIIFNLNNNMIDSEYLNHYKKIYMTSINILQSASEEIIKLMKKQRVKRMQIPHFVNNIQKFHKDNLKL